MSFGIDDLDKKYRPGEHPAGMPFTELIVFAQEQEWHDNHWSPPSQPTRELWEYPYEDADMPVYVRDLTEAEYQEDMKAYRKAMREWNKTDGVLRIAGALHTTATFRTEKGFEAEGVWDEGQGWVWVRYDMRPRAPRKPRVSARYRS